MYEPGTEQLVVVSNRLPIRRAGGGWEMSSGGLVAALEPVLRHRRGTWVGWAGEPGEPPAPFDYEDIALEPVAMAVDEVEAHYEGVSNAALWPLYHHAIRPPVLDAEGWWDVHRRVNRRFAERVVAVAEPGATVWVHDYHLQLVPAMVRARRPDLRIGFFLHIPFPPAELFRRLPWRDEIVEGLLGADLVGFQTESDVANFRAVAGRDGRHRAGRGDAQDTDLEVDGRPVHTEALPISIDVAACRRIADADDTRARAAAIRRRLGDPEIVLVGVDRLDYSKGIVERLEAFQRVLRDDPALASRVTMVQVAVPSRERVEEYERLRDEVERLTGHLNGSFGGLGRPVVHYHFDELTFEEVVALYLAADVLLVTPLADGMNLVAKEFAVARDGDPAAVVISEFAGAARELGDDAIVVNPFDPRSIASGIREAIGQDRDEQSRRMAAMASVVSSHGVFDWATDFLDALNRGDPSGPGPLDLRETADDATRCAVQAEHLAREAGVAGPAPDMAPGERVQWLAEQQVRVGEAMENG